MKNMNILIGGEAGQGLATVGQLLAKALVRAGYRIVVTQDYMSRIRGGHNTFAIRTGVDDPLASVDAVDILVALNNETVVLHKDKLTAHGVVLLDAGLDACELQCVQAPFKEIAPKPIFENVAALGALGALLGLDRELLAGLVADTFGKKGQEIINQNVSVLDKAYDWIVEQSIPFPALPKVEKGGPRIMVHGNEAIALGALAARVKFCSFYPMTPSTSVPLNLIAHGARMGVVVEQVEDEIAAVNMALGASYAGGRAVAATSGGGFALMVEGVSLAGMLEQPLVFVLAQRPGPATGLPTRTGQGDLNLVLYAGHGEFPRAIFAPGDIEECFELSHRAFDQTEKHQSPVFVLTDQYLADSYRSVAPFDVRKLPDIAGPDLSDDTADAYERYAVTESGVSPRRIPGVGRSLVVADSDEHTPDGHITEDLGVRVEMEDKRLRKEQGLLADVLAPEFHGDASPDVLLVCWGSTKGAALEAMAELRAGGEKAGVLHFRQIFPLVPEQFLPALESAGRAVCVEGNSTGQFAALIRQQTGFVFSGQILRYDGLPFTARYIIDRLEGLDG